MWWHTVTHGRGKWMGNWRMQWVASTLHTTSEHGVSSITTADEHTSAASSRLNWRPPADLNRLVRFAERRNLVSARVPSHFKRSLPLRHSAGNVPGSHPYAHPIGVSSLLPRGGNRRGRTADQSLTDHSYSGVLPSVISKPEQWRGPGSLGAVNPWRQTTV